MAYDETLALRIRTALARKRGVLEKKMFGGVGFLLHGNMLVGVWKDNLIVRMAPEKAAEALQEPFVKPFDITGKPMKGWLMVMLEGLEEEEQLQNWLDRATAFVKKLPPK